MISGAAGLPGYTLPPAGNDRNDAPPPFGARPASAPAFGARPASSPPPASIVHSEPGPAAYPAAGAGRPAFDGPSMAVPGTYSPTAQTSAPAYTPGAAAQKSSPEAPPTAPFGVGSSGSTRPPFGGSGASVGATPGHAAGVPQQRMQGTVYGGMGSESAIDMTMPVSMNAVDNSGSLTGHILAQGWAEPPDLNRRSNTKVAIAMLIVLLALVGISLLFLFTAGSAFTDMLNGVLKK